MRIMAEREAEPMLATSSLGELLVANRTNVGLELDELSRDSGFPVERIAAVESGRHDLSDTELSALLDRYAALSPTRRPYRALVEIDLDAGALRLRRSRRPRSLPAADRNLLHYLSMVHRSQGLQIGTEIPLKAVDLSLLRASLALRRGEVASRVDRMTGSIGPSLVRNRSLLAAAIGTGLIVAAGAIVLIPSGRSNAEPEPSSTGAIDPRIDIGTPLVVERQPSEVPGFSDPMVETSPEPGDSVGDASDVENGAAPPDVPVPQIGTPLVIERSFSSDPSTPILTGGTSPRAPPTTDRMISS